MTSPIFASNGILGDIDALASSSFVSNLDEELDDIDRVDVGIHVHAGVEEGDFETQLVEAERDDV